jgi:hypothetical protein
MSAENNKRANKPTIFQVIGSVVAAALGVQSEKNRQRDFREGASPGVYIAVGILTTLVFILTVIFVVRIVIHSISGS